MGQSQVLNWLNENEYRAYPLRLIRNREILITGLGRISPGNYDPSAGAYVMNGVVDTSVSPEVSTSFATQVSPGDQILINGTRASVVRPATNVPISATTMYTSSTWVPPDSYRFQVVKKNFTPDTNNLIDPNFEGLLLDANLVYNELLVDVSLYGKLLQVYPDGANLVIEVESQEDFIIQNYLDPGTIYPQYVRNAQGSLLVVGATAKAVVTPWQFSNCLFEPSVITKMDRAWRGVTSLGFNGSTPIDGYIEFLEGYQMGVEAKTTTNNIRLTASRSAGKPIGCDRIFDGDTAPDDCASLLSYINGAYARTDFGELNLEAGSHIAVYPDPDRHRIYVGLTFNEGDVCKTVPARPVSQL